MNGTIISITTDFAVQSQGVGIMEAVAYSIAPHVRYINLMHGLPPFELAPAARTLETVLYLPKGNHLCIVDPGVGSRRLGVIIKTKRGDLLIGPDNGVLIPAARMLGGLFACYALENPRYMLRPISPLFHGRDVFVPAAAHAANGVALEEFGQQMPPESLRSGPYEEAVVSAHLIQASIIHINSFGSVILNIVHAVWDSWSLPLGSLAHIALASGERITAVHGRTFSDVPAGHPVIMRDDYGRVELALNLANFAERHRASVGQQVSLTF